MLRVFRRALVYAVLILLPAIPLLGIAPASIERYLSAIIPGYVPPFARSDASSFSVRVDARTHVLAHVAVSAPRSGARHTHLARPRPALTHTVSRLRASTLGRGLAHGSSDSAPATAEQKIAALSGKEPSSAAGAVALGMAGVAERAKAAVTSWTPYALPAPPVLARAAFLYDVTAGRALYARNADMPLPMASTTKIMTALLAIEYGHLDDQVTASYAAATIGQSTMYLQQGERMSLRDLLYGLILPSGNDAAIAIAEHVGGSVPAFVAMMNREAAALGMTHTHFVTPHGLDAPGHYTSARDLARLTRVAMWYPLFRQIVSTRYYTIPASNYNYQHNLININQPLWWYPGDIGVKPGTTGAAGRCAVEWAVRGGHVLELVVLGDVNLVTDVRDLFNWGFGDFSHWYSPRQAPVVYAPEYFGWDVPWEYVDVPDGGRYYVRTGHAVRPPLLASFLRGGAMARYGAPTSEEYLAQGIWCQRFAASWLFYNPRTGKASAYEREVR